MSYVLDAVKEHAQVSDRIAEIEALADSSMSSSSVHIEIADLRYLLDEVKRLQRYNDTQAETIASYQLSRSKSHQKRFDRIKKLEAVREAAKEYFTLDQLEGLEFSPFFKAYHKVREALAACEEENG